jgi:hypothetical protein
MQTRRPLPLSVALLTAVVVACGDDSGETDATATATATTTTTTTSSETATTTTTATATATTTATATAGSDSDSASTTAGETTGAQTTGSTTEQTSGSTDASSGGATDTAGTDTGGFCTPGATESCYSGPDGTVDVGLCVAGVRTCNDDGTDFGPCEGEVTPVVEDCATEDDENCLGDAPECGVSLWTARFGDVAADETNDLAVGPEDGVVIVGRYDAGSTIDFGGDAFTNKGSFDSYVASFDGDGAHRWSRSAGSPGSEALRRVAVDSNGDVLVTGDTSGAIDLGGGLLSSVGDQDVVVAKYDSDGNHQWSAIYKSAQQQVGLHCAFDSAGEVILSGVFRGSIDLGGGDMSSAGTTDIYLAKLDADGKHLWSKRFGDAGADYVAAAVVDGDDAIIHAGSFFGDLNYGGATLTSAGGHDVFVAKLDGDGGHLWSKRFGDGGDQRTEAAATTGDGRVLIGGHFNGAIDFGGDVLTSGGTTDAFVAVLDGDGGHLWSRSFFGPNTDRVNAIAVDPDGNVLVAGVFLESIDVGGVVLTTDAVASFLVKFDPDGQLLFSESYNPGPSVWITDVAADSLGDAFLLGHFTGTVDVGGDALVSAGADDVFLAKIAP